VAPESLTRRAGFLLMSDDILHLYFSCFQEQKYLPKNIQFAICAAQQAVDDAGLVGTSEQTKMMTVCNQVK
jgi:3-oxoacyl-(acyl-carrier-protein) synthase